MVQVFCQDINIPSVGTNLFSYREVLPFDCLRAVPVPKPVGGTLVFAVNSLFYLNQGLPIYGVSLNATGYKDATTDILIGPLEGVKVSLDCAVA